MRKASSIMVMASSSFAVFGAAAAGCFFDPASECLDAKECAEDNGTGGGMVCSPTSTLFCPYTGLEGTEGIGICVAGSKTCNADGNDYGPCLGEVTPRDETCDNTLDDDCNGLACAQPLLSRQFGDLELQYIAGAGIDSMGNIYIAGGFQGAVDFGGAPLVSAGDYDLFVAKLDPGGQLLWSRRYGDVNYQLAASISVDASGNVAFGGFFEGTVDFGGVMLTSTGGNADFFVLKMNTNGETTWAKAFGDGFIRVGMDLQGNVYTAGTYFGTVNFGLGDMTSLGAFDIFLAKLSGESGAGIWSKSFGDGAGQYNSDIAVDSAGSVFIAGDLGGGTVNFGGDDLNSDVFIAKFDSAGNHNWSKGFTGTHGGPSDRLAVDLSGNLIISGNLLTGTFELGGPPLEVTEPRAYYIGKLSSSGAHLWSRSFGDSGAGEGTMFVGTAVDPNGNVLLTGNITGDVDFGGGALAGNGTNLFVAKLDPAGQHLWSRRFGTTPEQVGSAIAAGEDGILVAGHNSGTLDFGLGPLTTAGKEDIVLAKFAP